MEVACGLVGKSLKHRKTLAEAIRLHRKRAGLTQEKLGELADLNPKYIGEVERCEKTISVDALARIAEAVQVHLGELFREAPSPTPAARPRRGGRVVP
ncbi:MAG: helix-turn-helix transcriptional regulator [Verrucomicrobiae bacterium]|nr:helix-turn-helix transcriptional regulator [Verrucomicrobiae bacterium]